MVRRYNPYYNRNPYGGNNPFQSMDSSPTPITLTYKPSVDPAVLQNSLARRDKEFNMAKRMPQSLISGLNKINTFDPNRQALSQKFDADIKDIQRIVQEEYGGDWGKASDYVLNRVNRLQGELVEAEQDYKEYKPKQQAIWEAQTQGKGIYFPSGSNIANIDKTGTLQYDEENNRLIRNPIKDDARFYDMSKLKRLLILIYPEH